MNDYNVGGKIKTYADVVFKITCGLLIFFTIIAFIGMIIVGGGAPDFWFVVFFDAIIYFIAWLGKVLVYGYGQLIENSDRMVNLLMSIKNDTAKKEIKEGEENNEM